MGEDAGQGNEAEEKMEREGKRVARTRGGDRKEGKEDVGKKRERRTGETGVVERLALVPSVVIPHLSGRLLSPCLRLKPPRAEPSVPC